MTVILKRYDAAPSIQIEEASITDMIRPLALSIVDLEKWKEKNDKEFCITIIIEEVKLNG